MEHFYSGDTIKLKADVSLIFALPAYESESYLGFVSIEVYCKPFLYLDSAALMLPVVFYVFADTKCSANQYSTLG